MLVIIINIRLLKHKSVVCDLRSIHTDANEPLFEPKPYLLITEQPNSEFRFRYKSEMAGTHGCIRGTTSKGRNDKIFPSVTLNNFNGYHDEIIIRCTLYQVGYVEDFFPHPHKLMLKRNRKITEDPHEIEVGPENGFKAEFKGLGIIHNAKRDNPTEQIRMKIYKLKCEAKSKDCRQYLNKLDINEEEEVQRLTAAAMNSVNYNVVALRFDAFRKCKGVYYPICTPVYSNPIKNLKSAETGQLKIVRRNLVSGPTEGDSEMFLFVERIRVSEVKVAFYELNNNGEIVWKDYGRFNELDVHHQVAMVVKTPRYKDQHIRVPVKVLVRLERGDEISEALEFKYVPNKSILYKYNKKRKYDESYDVTEINNMPSTSAGLNSLMMNEATRNNESCLLEYGDFNIDNYYQFPFPEIDFDLVYNDYCKETSSEDMTQGFMDSSQQY